MIQELRIYYESIEQAYHYVLPIIQESIKTEALNVEVKLIKISKDFSCYSRRLAAILFWKVPDILISVVHNDEEYPIILIEFSTAVFTEDHELQRFDGMVAAAKNNCIYIKISPTRKKSPSEHGGKIVFDYTQPFSLIYSKYGKPYFHFEWQYNNNTKTLETDPQYLSCPKRIPKFEALMKTIIKQIIKKGYSQEWIAESCALLQNDAYFRSWFNKIRKRPQINIFRLNTTRTRYIKREPLLNSGALEVKLNRFGHAMDPERGMLAYYGTLTPNVISKMVFSRTGAWYKNIPKEKEIRELVNKGLNSVYDFLYCFALGSGLYSNDDFMNIVKKYKNYSAIRAVIDLTQFIQKNLLSLNKALKTIFIFSKLFVIEDDSGRRRVIFKWAPFQEFHTYEDYPKITTVIERETLDEDDVTYIVVHNILKPNGYKIVAVSYPGAQGDRKILIQPRTGRQQPRKYVDIISFLPEKVTALEENKSIYNRQDIQESINELSLYKKDSTYIQGLENFKKIFAPESINTVTKIGVGFWANNNFTASCIKELDLRELDYFVYITPDRKQWKIWRTGEDNIFKITSGAVKIPKTYEITKEQNSSLMSYLK